MKPLVISGSVQLHELAHGDVDELHALIEANRGRLSEFLPWAAAQTPQMTAGFVVRSEREAREGDGVQAAISEEGRLVGVVGLGPIDRGNLSAPIGYWIGQEHEGRGIARAAVRAICGHAFDDWGLNRLEIRVAIDNARSRKLAEALGFRQEGILRQSQVVNGRPLDCRLYAMLAREWPADSGLPRRRRRPQPAGAETGRRAARPKR